ncbi:MAG TPA: hypothetical protein VF534_06740 [Paraburkholderia sp.]
MGLPKQWFANRGQIVQTLGAAVTLAGAIGTALAKAPPWLTAGLAGVGIGAVLALLAQSAVRTPPAVPEVPAPPAPQSALRLERHDFVADDSPHINYKRKLYLVFVNDGAETLVIGPQTSWRDDLLHVSTVVEHVWQIEGPRGHRNNDWVAEANVVFVPPGRRVRTWVGLPLGATEFDVDAHISDHRAGALIVQVSQENRAALVI